MRDMTDAGQTRQSLLSLALCRRSSGGRRRSGLSVLSLWAAAVL